MEQERLQDIEIYPWREYSAGTEKKDKPNFRPREDVETTKEGFSTTRNALEKRQEPVQNQFPGASEWRVCVWSEEE